MKNINILLLIITVISMGNHGICSGALGFSPPATLNSNANSDSVSDWLPYVATDGAGKWFAVWSSPENIGGTLGSDNEIFISTSTDYGSTWTAMTPLNNDAGSDSPDWKGGDNSIHMATDRAGRWVAVWNSPRGGVYGTDSDIFVARSLNSGITWSTPKALNFPFGSDSAHDWNPQVATDGSGNWIVVWEVLGGAGGDRDIFFSRSTDNGYSWTSSAALNKNASSDSGDDRDPHITTDGLGNWIVVWESKEDLGGTAGEWDYDIFFSRSINNGITWSYPATLNTTADTDLASDDYNPYVAADSSGAWIAVWDSEEEIVGGAPNDYDIFISRSLDYGVTWAAPGVVNGNTAYGNDSSPQIATDGAGNWTAVWASQVNLGGTAGSDSDIFISHSTDGGVTWSDVAALNSNSDSDTGGDYRPQITADGSGHWLVVWESKEDLNSTADTDDDIFFSFSSFTPVTNWSLDYY
jgi:hypothetical protein